MIIVKIGEQHSRCDVYSIKSRERVRRLEQRVSSTRCFVFVRDKGNIYLFTGRS